MTIEIVITIITIVITMLLLIFVVDWRYFRDGIVVLLFESVLDFCWGSPVVNMKLIEYPVRLLPEFFNTSILFEVIVFPVLCVLYNQSVREKGVFAAVYYAVLFSTGIIAIEYPLEVYTDLIHYINWNWFTSFYTLIITFLISRVFIAFYRWGCDYFDRRAGD